jgi:large subunit ribosomal protein L9
MATPIRVVLESEVPNLGESGDIVRVRRGYARNFLIPRGLAVPATPSNVARVDELKRLARVRGEKLRTEADKLKAKLEAMSVKLSRAVGEENKMYGSVTAKDISDAYAAHGMEFDRRKLQLDEPLKRLGLHEVPLRLHPDVVVSLRVEVVKQTS